MLRKSSGLERCMNSRQDKQAQDSELLLQQQLYIKRKIPPHIRCECVSTLAPLDPRATFCNPPDRQPAPPNNSRKGIPNAVLRKV